MQSRQILYLFIVAILSQRAMSIHDTMNFLLSPHKRDCFFEDFEEGTPGKTVEAFVQAGGNADVLLTIHGPLDFDAVKYRTFEDPIVKETINVAKEVDSETLSFLMDFKPEKAGTYGVCLDNRKSRFVSKLVQLDIRLTPRREPVVHKEVKDKGGEEQGPITEEEGISRAKESLNRIRKGIMKLMFQQQRDRHRLSLHSETNVRSHNDVVTSSIVETAVFIAAAVFQLFFVRRWFSTRSVPMPVKAKDQKDWA